VAKGGIKVNPIEIELQVNKNISVIDAINKHAMFFLQKLLQNMHVDENGCWIFEGCVDPETGYGQMQLYYNKKVKVHRFVAYCFLGLDLFNLKLQACHECDVRNCINPFHLWIGTRSENIKDSSRKGRWHSGSYTGEIGGEYINHLKEKDWGKHRK